MSWLNNTVKRDFRPGFNAVRGLKKRGPSKFKRFLASVIFLSLGIVLCYTAMHYVGAFSPIGKVLSQSQMKLHASNGNDVQKLITNLESRSHYKRVYLSNGQSIEAEYSLPEGAQLDIHVLQCANRLILEVFNCKPIGERVLTVRERTQGSSKIGVTVSGFYYFSDKVTLSNHVEAEKPRDYTVLWRRA